jgi:hypothetical protein
MSPIFNIDFGNGYVQVAPPINKDAIKIDVIFLKDKARAALASIDFEWVGDTAIKINTYKDAGLSGGKGIAFGLPLRIDICVGLSFDLFLNLADTSARFECDKVTCPIRQAQNADWLEKQTQAYSFWYLASIGQIGINDYKKTPYLRNDIPDGAQIVTLLITEFMIVWQGIEIIDKIIELSGVLASDIAGLVPPTSIWAVLKIAWDIILIALYIVYFYILLNMFVQLIKEIIDNFMKPFPPNKIYKLCMREKDLFLKMCAFLGITFSSTIYAQGNQFENATWMPQKIVMPATLQPLNILSVFERPENEINNPKSYGYFDGTFSEYITKMEAKYNAEAKLINGVLYFEEKHFWNNINPYQIPNTDDIGYTFNLPAPHGTNLNELAPYLRLEFQLDESELNTIHRYRGTSVSITITSPFPINKYSGWGEGKIIDLGSALAKRKEHLNKIEVKIESVLQALNSIINTINQAVSVLGNPSVINPLPTLMNRIGWMEISNDSFSIPKTFIGIDVGGDWELHPQTEANMSAINLLNNFHGKELATRGNQYLTFFNKKSKFCCDDFSQILNSNILSTPDSPPKIGKFTKMIWNLNDEIAEDTDYRINQIYINGLVETIKIDGTN